LIFEGFTVINKLKMDFAYPGKLINLVYFPLTCLILTVLAWSIRGKPVDLVAIVIMGLYFLGFLGRFVI
jgi:hypothetical protein